MELLINVVFGLLLVIGIGAMLSMMSALIWMFWDMFFGKGNT